MISEIAVKDAAVRDSRILIGWGSECTQSLQTLKGQMLMWELLPPSEILHPSRNLPTDKELTPYVNGLMIKQEKTKVPVQVYDDPAMQRVLGLRGKSITESSIRCLEEVRNQNRHSVNLLPIDTHPGRYVLDVFEQLKKNYLFTNREDLCAILWIITEHRTNVKWNSFVTHEKEKWVTLEGNQTKKRKWAIGAMWQMNADISKKVTIAPTVAKLPWNLWDRHNWIYEDSEKTEVIFKPIIYIKTRNFSKKDLSVSSHVLAILTHTEDVFLEGVVERYRLNPDPSITTIKAAMYNTQGITRRVGTKGRIVLCPRLHMTKDIRFRKLVLDTDNKLSLNPVFISDKEYSNPTSNENDDLEEDSPMENREIANDASLNYYYHPQFINQEQEDVELSLINYSNEDS